MNQTLFRTPRLRLTPFSAEDFDLFVEQLLTDPRVVEHYHSFKKLTDIGQIRKLAVKEFWDHFEESRRETGLIIWAAYDAESQFVGWAGLIQTDLTDRFDGPELQYMLKGDQHGMGLATELATGVLQHAASAYSLGSIIATVDIPNKGSIRVLEKLGFRFEGQIEAYGSTEMFLYRLKT